MQNAQAPNREAVSKAVDLFHWRGAHGERLDLAVTGYQFPEIGEGYDANWLVVKATVSSPEASWTASSACVLAYDLLRLSYWFDDVDAGGSTYGWGSLEPDLMLDCLGSFHGKAAIAARLSHGLSDPSRREPGEHGLDLVIVWLSPDETAAARASIAEVLRTFPPRGEHGLKGLRREEDSRREALERWSRRRTASSGKDAGLGALTDSERDLLRRCLVAAVEGHFFSRREFGTWFDLEREDVVGVLSRWSEMKYLDPIAARAIHNSLTYLVGYPHGRDAELPAFTGATRSELARVYRKFLGEPPHDPSDAT